MVWPFGAATTANQQTASNLAGGASQLAPYPSSNYPASAFYGSSAAWLQPAPSGVTGQAAATDPTAKTHLAIAVVAIVAVGYTLWHLNYGRA